MIQGPMEWPDLFAGGIQLVPCRYCLCHQNQTLAPIQMSLAVCSCPCHWRNSVTGRGVPVRNAHLDAVLEFFRKDVEERLEILKKKEQQP